MFISEAMAQTTADAAGEPSMIMGYLPILVIFVVFYIFIIRPQNQKMKEHQALINGLGRGDKVVTDSGIYGEITKVIDDSIVEVQIAEGVKVQLVRNAVSALMTPESSKKEEKKAENKSAKKTGKKSKK